MQSVFPVLSAQRYQIEKKLGQGGGGVVYKAWDSNLKKPVVIKELFSTLGSEQERDALKNVKSKYLPQVIDFLSEGGHTYTVMEFIEGQSLDKLLEQGSKFSQVQVIKWYGQLAAALQELHKQNICHRDIKPANIMLLPNDDVCLIDFNAALVAGNDVQLISRSLGYCSPEQYEIFERYRKGEFSRTSAPIRYDIESSRVEVGGISGDAMADNCDQAGSAATAVLSQEAPGAREITGQKEGAYGGMPDHIGSDRTVQLDPPPAPDGAGSDRTIQLNPPPAPMLQRMDEAGSDRTVQLNPPVAGMQQPSEEAGSTSTIQLDPSVSPMPKAPVQTPPAHAGGKPQTGAPSNQQNSKPDHRIDYTAIDWKRSDIYSLGAAMYHLLSGVRPPREPSQLKPISEVGEFGEGIVYCIGQSMLYEPSKRFSSASVLVDAIKNIHKYDRRWKASQARMLAAGILFPLAFAVCACTAIYGRHVMAQEKEERYYQTVYEIENSTDPQSAYTEALAMYWNRIDPYKAMARRLWQEQDTEACRVYIESILGEIAEFSNVPEAEEGFGDIYYILGSSYYYQPGGPDYDTARRNFEIALQYVKDDPVYYRDYAVTLARTGEAQAAVHELEKAQVLNLDAGSLNLLNGEISYARQEYDSALAYFKEAIDRAEDDYVRYRAYHGADEILKLQGQPEAAAELVSGSLNRIPVNCVPEMTERLADAYIKCGDHEAAITLLEQLAENGVPQFHILQNLAILLENEDMFERAAEVLDRMEGLFPGDYRVPMRQAYLEADRQSQIANENRDYTMVKEYYDTAVSLYEQNVRPGEADTEMQQLEDIIEQLKANKWID